MLRRALSSPKGFKEQHVAMTDQQIRAVAGFANGDARTRVKHVGNGCI